MNSDQAYSVLRGEFQLRTRQALLAAQHSVRQVALLLLSFNGSIRNHVDSQVLQANVSDYSLIQLRNELRDSDVVMALAENEIGIVLASIAGREDIAQVIDRLMVALKEGDAAGNGSRGGKPRIGVAVYPEHGSEISSLFKRAEDALNEAKTNGRLYELYSSAEVTGVTNSRHWMNELRQAIVSEQLCLLYQPKIQLSSGHVTGVEVLTRWRHPKLGTILPDEFIPVAERTGLIVPLTLWVLQRALQQCRRWQDDGLDLSVAVNLTMWNLQTLELPEQIAALLRDVDLPPSKLELEITESAIMSDPERVIRTLSEIRELGVQFAIDDFGTGYSSFAYLKKLPVACIKIDKSFLLNIDADRDNTVILKSMVDLGHNLQLKVVAEGVETSESLEMLKTFGCDEGQGYFFSPPLGADALRLKYSQFSIDDGDKPSHESGYDDMCETCELDRHKQS